MTPATEDFARAINVGFDDLVARRRTAGQAAAVETAKASAFAAIAFLDQTIGLAPKLAFLEELLDA
ncbi:MAG: hypothetical protein RIB97_01055 [Nitratireductor sp.]